MAHFDFISATALIVSVISLSFVLIQIFDNILQRKMAADLKVAEINQQLIILGFSHPELFDVLDGKAANPTMARRFLQLWFNLFEHVYTYQSRGLFAAELADSLKRDIQVFMQPQTVRDHWGRSQQFYTPGFQNFVNSLLIPHDNQK